MATSGEILLRPRNIRLPHVIGFSLYLLYQEDGISPAQRIVDVAEKWLATDAPARQIATGDKPLQVNARPTEALDMEMRYKAAAADVSQNSAYLTAAVDWLQGPNGIITHVPHFAEMVTLIPHELDQLG